MATKSTTSAEQISDLRVDNASAFGGNTVLSERGRVLWMQKNGLSIPDLSGILDSGRVRVGAET